MPSQIFISGAIAGFLLVVTTVPLSVWVAQVGMSRGWVAGVAVVLGAGAALVAWALFFQLGIVSVKHVAATYLPNPQQALLAVSLIFRLLGGGVLLYFSLRQFRAPRAERLWLDDLEEPPSTLLRHTFVHAAFMPTLPLVALAMMVAAWLVENLLISGMPMALAGYAAGVSAWLFLILYLAARWARRIPEAITLRSLNKLSTLAGMLYLGLAAVVLAPLMDLIG